MQSIQSEEDKNYRDKICKILDEIGMPSKLKGYNYLKYAIQMVVEDFTVINSITKIIYTSVAVEYNTTPNRVERAIRNAIEVTWCKGNIEKIDSLHLLSSFKLNEKTRPTNSEFITMVVKEFIN
jgi:two-component system response regulator (stage 0 sporulation protein A)